MLYRRQVAPGNCNLLYKMWTNTCRIITVSVQDRCTCGINGNENQLVIGNILIVNVRSLIINNLITPTKLSYRSKICTDLVVLCCVKVVSNCNNTYYINYVA